MSTAIVTTSYAPDLARFRRLHESLIRHSTLHQYVFVPPSDVKLFRPLQASGQLTVVPTREVLPRHFVTTEWANRLASRWRAAPGIVKVAALDLTHPWIPIRGWVLQQVVKLGAATVLREDTLAFIDSESVVIRPITGETFRPGDMTRLFRRTNGVHEGMTRHIRWHRTARQLLGVPGDDHPPYDDFIGGITSWDRAVALECLARIEAVHSCPWQAAVAARLDVSEYTLYGLFARTWRPEEHVVTDRSLCHIYWESAPLGLDRARQFVEEVADDAVVVHVQSNTATAPEVEAFVIDWFSDVPGGV